ncbi:AAA domain (dynein-related subfamily) [uncultured archaeon]|nr:AAA domain (dynein-related subfamily) [uncultured archaeon]
MNSENIPSPEKKENIVTSGINYSPNQHRKPCTMEQRDANKICPEHSECFENEWETGCCSSFSLEDGYHYIRIINSENVVRNRCFFLVTRHPDDNELYFSGLIFISDVEDYENTSYVLGEPIPFEPKIVRWEGYYRVAKFIENSYALRILKDYYLKIKDEKVKQIINFYETGKLPEFAGKTYRHPSERYHHQSEIEIIEEKEVEGMIWKNLNLILYGPPGTGKTYETINKALEIIHKDTNHKDTNYCSGKERRELVEEFNKLLEKKQIRFITFHQSYSYEDFIEGIRPESKLNGSIEYPVKDGIFKQMCFEAAYELIKDQIEKVDRTFELAFKQFTDKFNDQELLLKTKIGKPFEILSVDKNIRIRLENGSEYPVSIKPLKETFEKWDQIEKVDDVWTKLGVGGGVESYVYAIVAYLKDLSSKIESADDLDIGYEAKKEHVLNKIYSNNFKIETAKTYVLIIDEINRGNISKIFGELITLVEEDKRFGAENWLKTTLPYSKEIFSVPSNLYIIGTMNTADRSIALLDIALRRRFTFEEMMPNLELLDEISIDGINLAELLEKLNYRITALIDRDHQIGHSYFLNLKGLTTEDAKKNLVSIWYKKIIPLLQEYFYNDWERLSLVLNEGFILKEENQLTGNYSCNYIYEIKPYDQWEDFKHSLESIMGEAQEDNEENSM